MKQLPTEELAKRSDIMITSTLSIGMFARDQRIITNKKRANMRPREIKEYVDEKYFFNALCKEYTYQHKQQKVKEKRFSDAYSTSTFAKSNYSSKALREFKEKIQVLNSFQKVVPAKDKKTQREEKIRHAQLIRAVAKKGKPKWDIEMVQKLMRGNFHDVEDEEGDGEERTVNVVQKHSVFKKFREEVLDKINSLEN